MRNNGGLIPVTKEITTLSNKRQIVREKKEKWPHGFYNFDAYLNC